MHIKAIIVTYVIFVQSFDKVTIVTYGDTCSVELLVLLLTLLLTDSVITNLVCHYHFKLLKSCYVHV